MCKLGDQIVWHEFSSYYPTTHFLGKSFHYLLMLSHTTPSSVSFPVCTTSSHCTNTVLGVVEVREIDGAVFGTAQQSKHKAVIKLQKQTAKSPILAHQHKLEYPRPNTP